MLDTLITDIQTRKESINQNTEGYKIGAVSRITGIGTETLRAWERRYQAITPSRTDSGDRKYSRDDIAKLLLLKRIADSGVSIGTIAHLQLDELKSLAETNENFKNNYSFGTSKNTILNIVDCNVALLGESFPLRILDGLEEIEGIHVVDTYESVDDLQQNLNNNKQVNVVIIEKPTINKLTQKEVEQILEITGAWHVIVTYGFANQKQIEHLQSTQTTVVRSSVDVQELARLCISHSGGSDRLPTLKNDSTLHYEQTIPSRIFNNKQLVRLAGISSTIKCECPKHISHIIKDLVAFEIYSAECENENTQDAALHSYLHATTAQARSMLEEALSHLIRIEGIDVNK
jgi:DNA-binding transcriptional MerR regulator